MRFPAQRVLTVCTLLGLAGCSEDGDAATDPATDAATESIDCAPNIHEEPWYPLARSEWTPRSFGVESINARVAHCGDGVMLGISPRIVLLPDGAPLVVALAYDDPVRLSEGTADRRVEARRLEGDTWVDVDMGGGIELCRRCTWTLLVGSQGEAHLVWEAWGPTGMDDRWLERAAYRDGAWQHQPGTTAIPEPGALALGPDGTVYSATTDSDTNAIHVRVIESDGTEAPASPLVTPAVGEDGREARDKSLSVDDDGRLYLAWVEAADAFIPGQLYLRVYEGGVWTERGGSGSGSGIGGIDPRLPVVAAGPAESLYIVERDVDGLRALRWWNGEWHLTDASNNEPIGRTEVTPHLLIGSSVLGMGHVPALVWADPEDLGGSYANVRFEYYTGNAWGGLHGSGDPGRYGVANSPHVVTRPHLAMNADRVCVTWAESRLLNPEPHPFYGYVMDRMVFVRCHVHPDRSH